MRTTSSHIQFRVRIYTCWQQAEKKRRNDSDTVKIGLWQKTTEKKT